MKLCGIYKISSPSGKVYIGQSTNINKRKTYYNNGCKGQPRLHNSIMKYGFNNHSFEILIICEEYELNKLEIYYADLFNCYDPIYGMNAIGCGGSKGRHSEETKRKMSEKAKGKNNIMYGKRLSQETKHKMRIAKLGKKKYIETRIKMSQRQMGDKNHFYGKKLTKEHREKLSKNNARPMLGVKHSRESRIKMSLNNKTPKKLILNIQNGIFYDGILEAANAASTSESCLSKKLIGYRKNNTPFIYA